MTGRGEDWLNGANGQYVEELYAQFIHNPDSVPDPWRGVFESFDGENTLSNGKLRPSFQPASLFNPASASSMVLHEGANGSATAMARLQDRVDQLVRAFRVRGHLDADINPLGEARPPHPELTTKHYELSDSVLDQQFSTTSIGGPSKQALRDILSRLRNTYCRSIGVQFMHIDDLDVRDWLAHRMEETENRLALKHDQQIRILSRLTDAVIFEQFVRTKYVGAKTFSLEGAESLIPLLHLAIEQAADDGVKEIVLGMAHRGRLNVLVNIMRKSPQEMFQEFEDTNPDQHRGRGDVKYHLGYSSDWTTANGKTVHLSLAFNPSHLAFVNPVVLGRTRAKQARYGDAAHRTGMALLIHGDAAFSGQGVSQETLNLSQLKDYSVGGALHVIVNNQIGFTTGPEEGRSCTYASDVAKMLQIPIFHVNGEDPEAVAQVVKLAMDFRRTFFRDVVIDMYCYRRRGHNESDEPSFTQPLLYQMIDNRPSVRDSYLSHMLKLGVISQDDADGIANWRRNRLEEALALAKQSDTPRAPSSLTGLWKGYQGGPEPGDDQPDTSLDLKEAGKLLQKLTEVPADFQVHRKLKRLLDDRQAMAQGKTPLDWASAELLAFASLAVKGHRIRLSGQDCGRGTFSQRHAVMWDHDKGKRYCPLQHLAPQQGPVEIINSPLSEIGVLGFEYGYSLDYPDGLVLWEAQFGDFCNVAQVIIDQFIASAEDKWRRLSGLVMLLPHGFEGQGPEHSSARMERFLMLCAEDNMQVVCPSTPAQYFHCLRRQTLRNWVKPLIVFTPKSLLRHPRVTSLLSEMSNGPFRRVIADDMSSQHVKRVLICTGKVYYDLLEMREQQNRHDVAIIRMEQLYPLPEGQLRSALKSYPEGTPVVWVQEEPENNGAWRYLRVKLGTSLFGMFPFDCVTRPESASPATGSNGSHKIEQHHLLETAFTLD